MSIRAKRLKRNTAPAIRDYQPQDAPNCAVVAALDTIGYGVGETWLNNADGKFKLYLLRRGIYQRQGDK